MSKVIKLAEAAKLVKDGDRVFFGGFLVNGGARQLIDELVRLNVKDLTLISNDTGFPDLGQGKLIVNKQIKKVQATHIGTNPETAKQNFAGELEVELIPQGTMAERIRAAGFGLGGILTPTGLGTEVGEGKEIMTVDGRDFLLEKPLFADVAILYADTVDTMGNMRYKGSEQNFNHVMASAATITIVESPHVIATGEMDPNQVQTPGVLIDYIVDTGGSNDE